MSGAIAAAASIGSSLIGGLFGKSNAKTAAAAAAQDQRQTSVDKSYLEQLMQELSTMDKSVVEKLFGTSNTQDIMNALQSTQGTTAEQQATESTVTRGDAATNATLSNAVQQLSGQLGGNNSEAFNAAMNQVLRSGMPAIAGAGGTSKAFGDTTTALLQNDLAVKAAEAGVTAQQTQQNNLVNQITQLAQGLQAGTETTKGQANTTAQQSQLQQTNQNNTSATTTTQDRTANEATTNQTSQGTIAAGGNTSDTLVDFGKDNSLNSSNILSRLGQAGFTLPAPTVGNIIPKNQATGPTAGTVTQPTTGPAPVTIPATRGNVGGGGSGGGVVAPNQLDLVAQQMTGGTVTNKAGVKTNPLLNVEELATLLPVNQVR